MCGVAAYIGKDKKIRKVFPEIVDQLSHRGPDGMGIWENDFLCLGHTRLSLVDISTNGAQPMKKGSMVISFNGEIYNFRELRDDLILRGYTFSSETDTEVILSGYHCYGLSFFDKLEGMYAIIIFDESDSSILVARDTFGIKPLYTCTVNGDLLFTSEIKPLKKLGFDVDNQAKILFLIYGFVPEPKTWLKCVTSFPAGTVRKYDLKSKDLVEEKKINFLKESINTRSPNSINEILKKSVSDQVKTDASLGTFLSGGLDSTILTLLSCEDIEELKAISVNFLNSKYSEYEYQKSIIRNTKILHCQEYLNQKTFNAYLKKFLVSMDQPTIDGFNTFIASKIARESGLKAVLSGVGADEYFYGYPSFRLAYLIRGLAYLPSPILKLFFRGKYQRLDWLFDSRAQSIFTVIRSKFSLSEVSSILEIKESAVKEAVLSYWDAIDVGKGGLLDQIEKLELDVYMRNQLLRDSDVFGMANSIEIRVPFLDRRLVHDVQNMQKHKKIKFRRNKPLLISAFKKIIPKEIYSRRKKGFHMPYEQWLDRNEFGLDEDYKKRYNQIEGHWSKYWAIYLLNRFE